MHKLKQLSASSFLRLLFAAFTFAFFCSAFIAPDRAEMFTGLRRIMTESSKVSTNYFDNGGYAGTFLNAGLVCLVLTALYSLPKVKVNATSCLAFLLTAGFCFWGVNILNLWFGSLACCCTAWSSAKIPRTRSTPWSSRPASARCSRT